MKKCLQPYLRFMLWFIGTFVVFFQFNIQSSASVLGHVWRDDFHLDKLGLGYLSAAFYYTFLFAQIPVGMLYDRYPVKRVMSLAVLSVAIGCISFSLTHDFYFAVMARMLMGAGCAFGFMGLVKICATWFSPKQFTFVLGASESISMVMVMLGMIGLSWLLSMASWRGIILGVGIMAFVLMLVILIVVRDHPSVASSAGQSLSLKAIMKQVPTLLKHPQVVFPGLYGFFAFAIVNSFTSLWGVSFLVHTNPIDRHTAVAITSMVFVGLAIGCPASGVFARRRGHYRHIMLYSGVLAFLTMAPAILIPGLPVGLLYILFLCTGMFCSGYIHCFAIAKLSVTKQVRFTAISLVNFIIMLSAPILQITIGALLTNHIYGWVNDQAWVYRIALGILPLGLLIMIGLCFFIKDPGDEQRT